MTSAAAPRMLTLLSPGTTQTRVAASALGKAYSAAAADTLFSSFA